MQQHVVVCQQQPLGVIPSRAFLFSVFTACKREREKLGKYRQKGKFSLCFYFTKLRRESWGETPSHPPKRVDPITLWVSKTTVFKKDLCLRYVRACAQNRRAHAGLDFKTKGGKIPICLPHLNFIYWRGQVEGETLWESTCKSVPLSDASLAFWPCL